MKERGNASAEVGDHRAALERYREALGMFADVAVRGALAKEKATLLSNKAEALLQTGGHKAAFVAASEALTLWVSRAAHATHARRALPPT
eukprot:767073-Prymnesium_polylepis.1